MKNLLVLLQVFGNSVHPLSKKVSTTARSLAIDGGYRTVGVVFLNKLNDEAKSELQKIGLDEICVFEDTKFDSFIPEQQIDDFSNFVKSENAEIVLFPATPEGRTLSSMLAANLKTGVTADCTELSFTDEGLLLQTRPAFSGNIMASIVTKTRRPQIASLRFSTKVKAPSTDSKIVVRESGKSTVNYSTEWLDVSGVLDQKNEDIIIAIGGGIKSKEDIEIFEKIASKMGASLHSSRMLVDRGWLSRKDQIGLSGQTVSPKLLITFGISGSIQFRAGLENIEHICAINLDAEAPIMKIADTPIVGDLYAIAEEINKLL